MKKLFTIALVTAFLLGMAATVMAAGTVTVTVDRYTQDVDVLTFTWTADAADGSVPATASNVNVTGPNNYPNKNRNYAIGCAYMVVTNPGTTAPTADYDITLTDADGVDIMGDTLADRSATLSEQVAPKVGAVYACRVMAGAITLNITNNSVNSATGTVKVYIAY
jgi:hypothetical protein